MSEEQLYLMALGVAMRFHFDLRGEEPEAVHAALMQANDDDEVEEALIKALSDARPNDKIDGEVSFMLESIQTLVDDIMETFRSHV